MIIRTANKNDINTIFQLERKVFEPDHYPLFVLRQYLDIAPDLFLIALNDNQELMGYALGIVNTSEELGWVLSLAANPAHKGKGVGKKLMDQLITLLQKKKVKTVRLTVEPNNEPALSIYKKMGFKETARDDQYYGPSSPRAILDLSVN